MEDVGNGSPIGNGNTDAAVQCDRQSEEATAGAFGLAPGRAFHAAVSHQQYQRAVNLDSRGRCGVCACPVYWLRPGAFVLADGRVPAALAVTSMG